MEAMIGYLLMILLMYLLAGIIFWVMFIWKGMVNIDPNTSGSSLWFKLIILPATAALWPVLLVKWLKSQRS